MGIELLSYPAAALFGILVGATELVARYKDRPQGPLRTGPGWLYVIVNGLAALGALWLIREIDADFGSSVLPAPFAQVLLAGFGTMAFFRSSVFSLRVGDSDVPVGPAAVLDVILAAADRACDRERAAPRSEAVARIMKGISFEKAREALPIYCFALMQNVPATEQARLGQNIGAIASSDMDDEVKSFNLGLILMNVVGEKVLETAVNSLEGRIRGPSKSDTEILQVAPALDHSKAMEVLDLCFMLDPAQQSVNRDMILKQLENVSDGPHKTVRLFGLLQRQFGIITLKAAVSLVPNLLPRTLAAGDVERILDRPPEHAETSDETLPPTEMEGKVVGLKAEVPPRAAEQPAPRSG